MRRHIPGDKLRCGEMAGAALEKAAFMLQTAEEQRAAGRLRRAISILHKASVQLGEASSLINFCQLEPEPAVPRLFARMAVLADRLGQDCEGGWKASLSGIDPYEAIRKWRKPLPPQKGGAHGGKKGRKGYSRKRDKWKREEW